jgi:hypothetical protein
MKTVMKMMCPDSIFKTVIWIIVVVVVLMVLGKPYEDSMTRPAHIQYPVVTPYKEPRCIVDLSGYEHCENDE